MLAALEAHQALFLRDAGPAASTSAGWKGKGVAVAEASSVWDGGMDEFDDAEANSEEDSEDDEMGSEGEERECYKSASWRSGDLLCVVQSRERCR